VSSWIDEIGNQHYKKYSQYGEEGYLKFILKNIGTTNRFLVDIGASDGKYLSNTKIFRDAGWESVLIDGRKFPGVVQSYVTVENILKTLNLYGVPKEFDLLSIDIDGNDYWVLSKLLTEFRPRLIISEYNSEFTDSRTIEYDPTFYFRGTDYYGYTFAAGLKLAERTGYKVIFQNAHLNMYYLRNDIAAGASIEAPKKEHLWWRLNDGPYKNKTDNRLEWVHV